MKILVIGGTGYIGRRIVCLLLERNHEVYHFSRGRIDIPPKILNCHCRGDRNDLGSLAQMLDRGPYDAVVDLAAFEKSHVSDAVGLFKRHTKRYVFISSSRVYFDNFADLRQIDFPESIVNWETIDNDLGDRSNPYAAGKRKCEKWLQEDCSVPYTIFRFHQVMGEADATRRMDWWVARILDGKGILIPESKLAPFRLLYVGDAAQAIVKSMTLPACANQTYHLSDQTALTIESWMAALEHGAGKQVPYKIVSDKDLAENGLDGYCPTLLNNIPYLPDTGKSRSDIGFTHTETLLWIATVIKWYMMNGTVISEDYAKFRETEIALFNL